MNGKQQHPQTNYQEIKTPPSKQTQSQNKQTQPQNTQTQQEQLNIFQNTELSHMTDGTDLIDFTPNQTPSKDSLQ